MIKSLLKEFILDKYPGVDFDVLIPPNPERGDYSINLAFVLAKKNNEDPIEMALKLATNFIKNEEFKNYFSKIESVRGFVNFYLSEEFLKKELLKIIEEKENYGSGKNKKFDINLEFVSANPTGPPTVGNARAAAYGDTLGNILKKTGNEVTKEYYINDVGVQVDKLAKSEINIDMENRGLEPKYKEEGLYKGSYMIGSTLATGAVINKHLDEENFEKVKRVAIENHVELAKKALENLGVKFDEWFHESELHERGEVEQTLERLKGAGNTEEKEGALWFKFGNNQEAVLVKSDGNKTYLMNDIAYSMNKLEKRKFDKAINIWGTDHHGDVARLLAGVAVLGHEGKLEILLHQLVLLKQKDERLKISKRAGNLVLLEDLIKDVGKDAVRFFFLAKDLNTHMEFDVDLAKDQSNKNPVYYIQYAYARLNQIFAKINDVRDANPSLLKEPEEIILIRKMVKFPELISEIAQNYQVHHLAQYAYDLASGFHNFYEKHRVVQENKELEGARIILCRAVAIILKSCLELMGISAPYKM